MFENVTVTDAMAEDMEKLRPRLKNVHIRELVVAIMMTPKMQKAMFTCGTKCHCGHAQPQRTCGPPHSTPRGLITRSWALVRSCHGQGRRSSELFCTALHLTLGSAHPFYS